MEYQYEFCVYGITEKQAEELMDTIVATAEEMGAHVGGGYGETDATTPD